MKEYLMYFPMEIEMAKLNPFLEPSFIVPDNLKKLPLRAVKIPDESTLNVPSFIRRVDIKGLSLIHI